YSLSPDEKHVAFVVHGELFRVPVTGGKAVRLTDSPAYDHGVSWSPDGKKLLFASDRGGYEDLYLLEPDDPEHPELTQAHRFKVTQITHTPEEEQAASFSPDGKRIVFLRSGRMWHAKPDGTDAQVLVDAARVIDYDWSPDGKWVVYSRMDGSFASELYILPFPNPKGEPARNVTRYATSNVDVTWSRTGHKLAFLSNRSDQTCVHVLALQKPAAPDAPRSDAIDWEDIHLRVSRPTSKPARHGAISPDGTQVAFRSTEGGDDLWLASVSGSSVQRLTTGNQRPQFIRWSKRSALGQIYYLNGSGELRIARPSGSQGQVNFRAEMVIRRGEEFLEMFDQTWRELADNFYDPAHHGTDWRAVREKYRPWVSHVRHKEDLYALISLMLGELNASHLGVSGPARSPQQATAELGLLFDERHPGPGLKVAEVLARGPADRRGLDLQPGDVVLAIDRTPLTEKVNLAELLNGKAGEAVLLEVTRNPSDPKDRRKIEIKAATRAQVQALMYDRWVARNAEAVAKLSGGRLGYIHIPAMNDSGLERFVRALYSDNFHKEGIVLDVRYNGGGFTHDQVLNYLVGRRHTVFRHRDGGEGTVLRSYDRKWTRPLTLLINNRSYSDAEIFPSAFRAWGLGRIVGQPTGGFVIGTGSASLIDGSTLRVPRTGVFRADGVNMEREGVRPDVLVVPHPAQVAAGEDPQLERAVEVLLGDVEAPKKQRPAVAGAPPAAPAPPAQNSGAGAPR
ncbi:MAG TPA: S41 family peptidase, partial [Gemmataceae bacterium]